MVVAGGGFGNSLSMTTVDRNKYKELTSSQLSNTQLINTVSNLIAKTISTTIANNSASIGNIITLNNSINFTGGEDCAPMEGGINISNITQQTRIDSTTTNVSINKIIVEITETINNNIISNLKSITEDNTSNSNQKKASTTFGGMATAVTDGINKVVGDVGSVVDNTGDCVGFGNSCSTTKITETEKELITKYKLDNDFKFSDSVNTEEENNSKLTVENLTQILSQITGSNSLGADGFCPTFIDISDIKQRISVNNIIDNSTITAISSKIASTYINKIDRTISNLSKHKVDKNTISSSGDIGDLGDAVAGVISAGGDAASGVIDSSGNAVASAGGAVITGAGDIASSGLGAAGSVVSGAISGLSGLLSGNFLIIIIIAAVLYFIVLPMIQKKIIK